MEGHRGQKGRFGKKLSELERALNQAARADLVHRALAGDCLERLREECEAVRAELQALNAEASGDST